MIVRLVRGKITDSDMAYRCENRLVVFGDKKETELFFLENSEEGGLKPLLFSQALPLNSRKGSAPGSLETREGIKKTLRELHLWRRENWGTQFEPQIKESDVVFFENKITYTFKTETTPPLRWLIFVSRQYKGLSFCLSYREPEINKGGAFVVYSGAIFDRSDGKYSDYI